MDNCSKSSPTKQMMPAGEKLRDRKVAKCYLFQYFVCLDGREGSLAKVAGAEPSGERFRQNMHAA